MCPSARACLGAMFRTPRDDADNEQSPEQQQQRQQQQAVQANGALHGQPSRVALPDRRHPPPTARTASSTPRTRSTAHAASDVASEDLSMHTALDISFGSSQRRPSSSGTFDLSQPP